MVLHWYNEILIISHYLGIAILKCERAAPAATACPVLLDRRASMFRNVLYRLLNIYRNLRKLWIFPETFRELDLTSSLHRAPGNQGNRRSRASVYNKPYFASPSTIYWL